MSLAGRTLLHTPMGLLMLLQNKEVTNVLKAVSMGLDFGAFSSSYTQPT